uniref:23 kDa jasmonate-induced protein-like n=1 Tax=Erigeron canadensis TaxID=72917 RepID=UPI001CB8D391|nr:23 kDa jasmonate-induced protein-like [Erigeron canadensis]
MADNVFGITVRWGSRLDRALKAMEDTNVGGKRDQALAYVKEQKKKFGDGVSTLCIFYNATGENLFYVDDNSSYGKIYDSYPVIVHNGQWGAFLHIKKPGEAAGSGAFVVYSGKYNNTDYCKHLIAWDVPCDQLTGYNHAYCGIYDEDFEINTGRGGRDVHGSRTGPTRLDPGTESARKVEPRISPLTSRAGRFGPDFIGSGSGL